MDWSIFDFVGLDLYRDGRIREIYGKLVKPYLMNDKPVLIGEFGCCAYQGAEKLGGMSWAIIFGMIADGTGLRPDLPGSISDMPDVPTRIDGHYIRDEGLQALELTDQLRILDDAGVEGAFVFNFISPKLPFNEDPRYELDMASYGLVKSYAEKESVMGMINEAAEQAKELLGVEVDPKVLSNLWERSASMEQPTPI